MFEEVFKNLQSVSVKKIAITFLKELRHSPKPVAAILLQFPLQIVCALFFIKLSIFSSFTAAVLLSGIQLVTALVAGMSPIKSGIAAVSAAQKDNNPIAYLTKTGYWSLAGGAIASFLLICLASIVTMPGMHAFLGAMVLSCMVGTGITLFGLVMPIYELRCRPSLFSLQQHMDMLSLFLKKDRPKDQ